MTNEASYEEGRRSVWLALLREALGGLHYSHELTSVGKMAVERVEAVTALRSVCGAFGDNDWPDNLALADVIEKHLHVHLE